MANGSALALGCQCEVIRGKMYYGLGLPRPAWMKDQLWFELIMEEMKVINARLQLYGPLSPVSSNGWDGVGSSSSSVGMADWPFEESTSKSSNIAKSFVQATLCYDL